MAALNYNSTDLLGYRSASARPPANRYESLAISKYISDGVFNSYTSYGGNDLIKNTDPTNPIFEHSIFNLNA